MSESDVDGNLKLDEQRNTIRYEEMAKNVKLVSYQKRDNVTNLAKFDKVPVGQPIPDLVLVEVVAPATIETVKAAQQALGKSFIFFNPAFVAGKESKVAGFR